MEFCNDKNSVPEEVNVLTDQVQKLFRDLHRARSTLAMVLNELNAIKAAHAKEMEELKAELETERAIVRAAAQEKQAWREMLGMVDEDGYHVIA
jgi:regulator of replication initiation timing